MNLPLNLTLTHVVTLYYFTFLGKYTVGKL